MIDRRKLILIVGLVVLIGALVVTGYAGEHNRDIAAAERGERTDDNDGGGAPIAALVVIFAAVIAASQSRKPEQDGDDHG